MNTRVKLFTAVLTSLLFCSLSFAQDPVVNIDKVRHQNLAKAQELIAEAHHYIVEAQKVNKYDMKGNATHARQLLVQASQELKAAAEIADADAQKTRK